jgi:heme/copper-type cytochrome/quinol oxidase subunit 3
MSAETSVAEHEEHHDGHPDPVRTRKVAMWVFLGSECLFFGTLISTFLLYRTRTGDGPTAEEIFDIPFTTASSFILLMSSLTMVLAHHSASRRDWRRMRIWLLGTAFLGSVFLAGQVFEFTEFVDNGLTVTTSPFGTSFYVLTSFHGAHVAIGVIMLLATAGISYAGKLRTNEGMNVEMVGPVLALRRHRLDRDLHRRLPAAGVSMAEATHHRHPTPLDYWKLAFVLGAITAAEVWVTYVDALDRVVAPLLLAMGAAKFVIVVGWYMHLRFEERLMKNLFYIGIIAAPILFGAVLFTFGVLIGSIDEPSRLTAAGCDVQLWSGWRLSAADSPLSSRR